MRRRMLTVAAVMLTLLPVSMGNAGVSVNIGIDLPGPPALVPVPATPVMYAPGVSANYFSYGGQYYAFVGGVWHVSPGYNGPWVVVAPEVVPRPILAVPVGYYRVPPPGWHGWRAEAPPHWDPRWGRHWAGHGWPPVRRRVVRHEVHRREPR